MWTAIPPQSDPRSVRIPDQPPGSVSDRSEPSERSEGPASPKKATSTEVCGFRGQVNGTADVVGKGDLFGWKMILFFLFGKDVLFGKVNGWRFTALDIDDDLDIGDEWLILLFNKLWQYIQELLSASILQLLIWFFSVSWKETCVTAEKGISTVNSSHKAWVCLQYLMN